MFARIEPLSWPSLRRSLIRIHRDLFRIHHAASEYFFGSPLSTFEIMVLILEDRRYFTHHGIDIISCIRELCRAVLLQRHGGASTIDMQFVRTVTGYKQRTIRRKAYEMLLAVLIQFKYSRVRILRSYLAIAFFGSHLKGAENASFKVFRKHPDILTIQEAAMLAAMLVYPMPLVPTDKWFTKVRRRTNYAESLYPRYKERYDKLPRWEEV